MSKKPKREGCDPATGSDFSFHETELGMDLYETEDWFAPFRKPIEENK